MAQRPMVDVQPFSGPMWDGSAAGLNLELAGGQQTGPTTSHVEVDHAAGQFPAYDQGHASTDDHPEGVLASFEKRLESALNQSTSLASAVESSSMARTIETVLSVTKPLFSSALKYASKRDSIGRLSNSSTFPPLPMGDFPDVPESLVDGLAIDPFSVDLMLNNNIPMPGIDNAAGAAHQQKASGPKVEASVSQEGIQQSVQSELSNLKTRMLWMEQKAPACMQKNWGHQRMAWRMKVKQAANIIELMSRLKEFRRNLLPFARSVELDQMMSRISPTNVTAAKLSRCLAEFAQCITRNFPTSDILSSSLQQSLQTKASDEAMLTELEKVISAHAAGATAAAGQPIHAGIEALSGFPLGELFSRHPELASTIKRLLQKEKAEAMGKLADLNLQTKLGPSASMGKHTNGNGREYNASVDGLLVQDDGNTTDMSSDSD
mmetsp:Transcript_2568/g.6077  ORF Transcript_2568/g.6077 Transcript_2568/m.6077 type:complete len:435 (+) Transcript_2568:263-1567(+)